MRLFILILIITTGCSVSIDFKKQNVELERKIQNFEKIKLKEINQHNKEVYEMIKNIYENNDKAISLYELKQAELKYKLSQIDLEIQELKIISFKK